MPANNVGCVVTLTTAGTRYKLASLVSAIDPAFLGVVNYLNLFSPFANGGAIIYKGDSAVTSSRYGYVLAVGGYQETIAPFRRLINWNDIWVVADTNNTVLAVDAALWVEGA